MNPSTVCGFCKRTIWPFQRRIIDLLGRTVHRRCNDEQGLTPVLRAMVVAMLQKSKLQGFISNEELQAAKGHKLTIQRADGGLVFFLVEARTTS